MSFLDGIGGLVKSVLPELVHMGLDAVCPEMELIPGLTDMVSNMVADQLGKAIDGAMQQSGSPAFQIKDVLNMLKQAAQDTQQPCDPGWGDHIKDKFGGIAQNMVDNLIKDFTDALKNYKNDSKNCEHGGKGGKGGSAGAGDSGPVTFRDLAAALGQLEQDEAKRVKDKVQAASDALGQADQAGTGKDGAVTQGDNDKNAQNKQDQFKAMEESKAEAQIFQTLSSAISEVMKNFGGALQTAARGG